MESGNERNRRVIEQFRANGGRVDGRSSGQLLLLTTTGAKSGRPYTTPVMYLPDGDRMAIFASKGGAPTNPDWYHNLVATPRATVEVGSETFEVKATVAEEAEHDRLYTRQSELVPVFADYQQRTTRKIPVVILERIGPK